LLYQFLREKLKMTLVKRVSATEAAMRRFWHEFRDDKWGVTALEYALIAALVAVVIIGGVSLLGTNVSKVFSTVASTI
jgi:pilus assembly protein Flp/PilA